MREDDGMAGATMAAEKEWFFSGTADPVRWRRGYFGLAAERRRRRQRAGRPWTSLFLHAVGAASSHSAAGIVVAVAVVGWLLFGVIIDFPNWWDNALYISSSIITLVMVFAIQHTQARQQAATQRKLDELLLSHPRADDRLVAIEQASDVELESLTEQNIADREHALKMNAPEPAIE